MMCMVAVQELLWEAEGTGSSSREVTHKSSYQKELDTVEMWRAIPACVLLAIFVHGDLNDSPVYLGSEGLVAQRKLTGRS